MGARGRYVVWLAAVAMLVGALVGVRAAVAPPASDIPARIHLEAVPDATWELVESRDFGPGGLPSLLPWSMRGAADDVHGEWVWRVGADLDHVRSELTVWLTQTTPPGVDDAPGGQARVEVRGGLEGRTWTGWLGRSGGSALTGELRRGGQSNRVQISFQRDHQQRGTTQVRVRS
jgi:hypothetical protein